MLLVRAGLVERARNVLPGVACALLGCARPAPSRPSAAIRATPPVTTAAAAPHPTTLAPSASATPEPTASRTPPPCSPETPADLVSSTRFEKLHSGPVLSVAVGTPPRAAIWSGQAVTLFQGGVARELPAPRLPEGAGVELFFGRDDQPRLMGFAPGQPGREIPVYLRFRQGVFRPEPSELGPLGAPRGALYGVLGFDDPEVVCRPRALCLVKRTSGWSRVAAHDAPARIVLRGANVFALHATRIERLAGDGWSELEPKRAFDRPLDVWQAPNGEVWVTDESPAGLFRATSSRWEAVASPVTAPRAVLGRSDGAVYVAGANGAAELDGTTFRCLYGVTGPLHRALAVGHEIWLAGAAGVYRSAR